MTENKRAIRSIGVGGAVFTMVGFVIGMAIFILPGQLAVTAGPAVILSYFLASLVALLGCLVFAQLGVCFPVSGAGFVLVSMFLSPMWGVLLVWLMYGMVSFGITFLAYGFADYLGVLWPDISRTIMAAFVVFFFMMLNLLNVRSVIGWQAFLVIWLLFILGVVVSGGISYVDYDNLIPFLPNGISPVLVAAVPAFFSFGGFAILLELGGELKDPKKTIPLSLFLAFFVVLLTYLLVSFVVVGVVPWQQFMGVDAPIAEVAGRIYPEWVKIVVTVTALVAAGTSVNAFILGYSRYVVPLSELGILSIPDVRFFKVLGAPAYGVLMIGALSMLAVFMEGAVVALAAGIVIILMISQIMFGIVLLRLKFIHPEILLKSSFYLGGRGVVLSAVGLIIASLAFIGFSIMGDFTLLLWVLAYSLLGIGLYFFRNRRLKMRGICIRENIHNIYGFSDDK